MPREFVDENLPWPLWRPIVGTIIGGLALAAVSLAAPLDTRDTASLLGGLFGRTILAFAILYFPAYSRRGWAWRICAFALLYGTAFVGNDVGRFIAAKNGSQIAAP